VFLSYFIFLFHFIKYLLDGIKDKKIKEILHEKEIILDFEANSAMLSKNKFYLGDQYSLREISMRRNIYAFLLFTNISQAAVNFFYQLFFSKILSNFDNFFRSGKT
jgi:hypothetical protein